MAIRPHTIFIRLQKTTASGTNRKPRKRLRSKRVFAREEILLPVKCNQHPWMRMFVNVVKNPFFAVSGADGKFEIKGLPPGDYTLAFVQEKLGEQDEKVTLAAKDSKTVELPSSPARRSADLASLRLQGPSQKLADHAVRRKKAERMESEVVRHAPCASAQKS